MLIHPTVSERRYTSGSEYFPGLIDEAPIYNIGLSEAQVQKHFAVACADRVGAGPVWGRSDSYGRCPVAVILKRL